MSRRCLSLNAIQTMPQDGDGPKAHSVDCADVAGDAGYVVETMGAGMRVTIVEEHDPISEREAAPSAFYDIEGWDDIRK